MARLPRPTGSEMIRFLKREGFLVVRIRGSHHVMERGDVQTVVPVHGNRPLAIGTLRKILRDIGMAPDEFTERFNS